MDPGLDWFDHFETWCQVFLSGHCLIILHHLPNTLKDAALVKLYKGTMPDASKYSIVTDAVMLIRADITYGPRLSNCWLAASTWGEALRKSNLIDVSISIDVRKFNKAMHASSLFGERMHQFDGSNTTGVFRIKFYNQLYYYITKESSQVSYPFPFVSGTVSSTTGASSSFSLALLSLSLMMPIENYKIWA